MYRGYSKGPLCTRRNVAMTVLAAGWCEHNDVVCSSGAPSTCVCSRPVIALGHISIQPPPCFYFATLCLYAYIRHVVLTWNSATCACSIMSHFAAKLGVDISTTVVSLACISNSVYITVCVAVIIHSVITLSFYFGCNECGVGKLLCV